MGSYTAVRLILSHDFILSKSRNFWNHGPLIGRACHEEEPLIDCLLIWLVGLSCL
ncbi:Uncharacterized protein ChrSV_3350 [Chromobacterium vaccinii]|nr:Uncharacterized protein ChrSW_3350 [Chromobacterium vaccinii]QND90807.1 Uncharacterized protein ChrSV_3350 [Chromobacterium vaccinii]